MHTSLCDIDITYVYMPSVLFQAATTVACTGWRKQSHSFVTVVEREKLGVEYCCRSFYWFIHGDLSVSAQSESREEVSLLCYFLED